MLAEMTLLGVATGFAIIVVLWSGFYFVTGTQPDEWADLTLRVYLVAMVLCTITGCILAVL